MKRLLRPSLLVITTFAVALLLSEGLLRVLPVQGLYRWTIPASVFPWLKYDPVLAWKNTPHHENTGFRLNSLGQRGPEVSVQKKPGVKRILTLGDSGTFGIWVKNVDDNPAHNFHFDSYAEILRTKIAEAGYSQFEVINAGTVGYTTSHGLRLLMTHGLEFQPDIVTVRLGYNDSTLTDVTSLRALEPSTTIGRWVLYHGYKSELVRLGLAAFQRTKRFHPSPMSIRHSTPEQFRHNLHRLAEVSREKGFRLIFLDYPIDEHPSDQVTEIEKSVIGLKGLKTIDELYALHAQYLKILDEVAAQEKIPVVRTADALHACQPKCYSPDDHVHPNDRGAELTASLLFEALKNQGWLEPSLASR